MLFRENLNISWKFGETKSDWRRPSWKTFRFHQERPESFLLKVFTCRGRDTSVWSAGQPLPLLPWTFVALITQNTLLSTMTVLKMMKTWESQEMTVNLPSPPPPPPVGGFFGFLWNNLHQEGSQDVCGGVLGCWTSLGRQPPTSSPPSLLLL